MVSTFSFTGSDSVAPMIPSFQCDRTIRTMRCMHDHAEEEDWYLRKSAMFDPATVWTSAGIVKAHQRGGYAASMRSASLGRYFQGAGT